MTFALEDAVGFGRWLRRAGLDVDATRMSHFAQAVALTSPHDAYWAGRATLVSRPQDIAAYDRAFRLFFNVNVLEVDPDRRDPAPAETPPAMGSLGTADDGEFPVSHAAPASAVERLKAKRFEDCTPHELAYLADLMRRVAWSMPARRTRRYERSQHGALDARRMVRQSWRTGGEVHEVSRRERRRRRRRMVMVLDISGSMAPYSRALLVFAHAAVSVDMRWEAFCFGTRLTRVTAALRAGAPDQALRAAAAEVLDWDGGTRIGDSLKALLDEHGDSRILRGSVVLICSDGLDVGEPAVLGAQMERLSRLASTVVWINPLSGEKGYEPLARGMAAALPHIDLFAPGHDLNSLENVARRLERIGRRSSPVPSVQHP